MVKSTLAGLFGRSPFTPMQKHMETVRACAAELLPLIEAVGRGDQEEVEARRQKIFNLEAEADLLQDEIRSNLPTSLFMPVDRRDLLEVLQAQDSIANTAQDVAGLCVLKALEVPESIGDLLQAYTRRVFDAVVQCEKVVRSLDELLEVGFRGRQAELVGQMITELVTIETETDDQGMELSARIFQLEDELSVGSFYLWQELLRRLGDVADAAEQVGKRLRLLLAR